MIGIGRQVAEREFRRAIDLNPNYVNAHQWYSLYAPPRWRLDEALAEVEHAREIDPLSSIVMQNYFTVRLFRGDVDQLPAIVDQIASIHEVHDDYVRSKNILPLLFLARRVRKAFSEIDNI